MTEELNINIEVDRLQKSRVLGGKSFRGLAPLLEGEQEVYLVYDEQVAWVATEVVDALRETSGAACIKGAIAIDTSEEEKSMDTVLAICRQLLDAGASRKALVLAIGGGITTDMAGFAASIYKRGIRYANLPTTLLAQVDAAIGGKTGVNLDSYKNMLGAIVQPEFTYLSADVLRTLPPREFRSGAAELVKTFLLGDAAAYEEAIGLLSSAEKADGMGDGLQHLIERAAAIKAGVVQRDPFEKGERAKLNLGHTFAHAMEHEARRQGDDLTHGEAVAMGMILAAELSEREGTAQKGLAARLRADFKAAGLPTDSPYPMEVLRPAMLRDKKATGGTVRFVLFKEIGQVEFRDLEP